MTYACLLDQDHSRLIMVTAINRWKNRRTKKTGKPLSEGAGWGQHSSSSHIFSPNPSFYQKICWCFLFLFMYLSTWFEEPFSPLYFHTLFFPLSRQVPDQSGCRDLVWWSPSEQLQDIAKLGLGPVSRLQGQLPLVYFSNNPRNTEQTKITAPNKWINFNIRLVLCERIVNSGFKMLRDRPISSVTSMKLQFFKKKSFSHKLTLLKHYLLYII